LVGAFADRCVMLADTGFHAAAGDPPDLKICQRGQWNDRMVVETALSMTTVVPHAKKMRRLAMDHFQPHLAMLVAAFSLLIAWHGLPARGDGFVPLSIAEFNL